MSKRLDGDYPEHIDYDTFDLEFGHNPLKSSLEDIPADTGVPDTTVIVVNEETDFNKMHEQALTAEAQKVRRTLIGLKTFKSDEEFIEWQREEPREIFEITPRPVVVTSLAGLDMIKTVIFVTYNAGVIE